MLLSETIHFLRNERGERESGREEEKEREREAGEGGEKGGGREREFILNMHIKCQSCEIKL